MNNSSKALLAGLLCAAAPAAAKVMEDTVAVINGSPILLSEYQKELTSALEYWNRAEPEAMRDPANLLKLREQTLEQLIDREVLYQEGGRRKVKVRERDIENGISEIKQRFRRDEEGREISEAEAETAFQKQLKADGLSYGQFRDRLSKQIMARKLVDDAVRARLETPGEKEVRAYFERVRAYIASKSTDVPKGMDEEEGLAFRQISSQIRAMSAERVRVSRILIKLSPRASENEKKRAKKTAQEIRRRLKDDPSTFPAIAKEESEDPESAARGGDIGYIVRGSAPPDFERAVFALSVGEISEPLETEVGYHIVRVQEKRAAESPDYDRFKDDLAKAMAGLGFQREVEKFVKGLKDKAVIERHLPPL